MVKSIVTTFYEITENNEKKIEARFVYVKLIIEEPKNKKIAEYFFLNFFLQNWRFTTKNAKELNK